MKGQHSTQAYYLNARVVFRKDMVLDHTSNPGRRETLLSMDENPQPDKRRDPKDANRPSSQRRNKLNGFSRRQQFMSREIVDRQSRKTCSGQRKNK